MPTKQLKLMVLSLLSAGLLSACGGGGDDPVVVAPPPPPAPTNVTGTDVPIAATQMVNELMSFAKQQQTATSDSSDPLVLGDATALAIDDNAEPADI